MAAAAAAPSTRRLLPPPAPAFAVILAIIAAASVVSGQRITTIQLDGTQYFVSRMNPYSPELNYFLAYQYCRSLGLQLASFESREKADSLMQYLRNAGYNKFDYWTSGNRLGTDMLLWMSTGAPFNTTFDYMRRSPSDETLEAAEGAPTASHGPAPAAAAPATGPAPAPATRAGLGRARSRRPGRQSAEEVATGCVALKSPALDWDTDDCLQLKDFICEQTRCYYYNYGSIPVSTSQGDKKARPTSAPASASSPAASSTPAASTATPAADESVHRRIAVRPQADDAATPASTTAAASAVAPASGPDPDPYPTELPSAAEDETPAEEEAEEDSAREDETPDESFNFASRSFPEKDAVANVVYVTAVGAEALNATGQYAAATATATAAEAVTAEGPAEVASAAAPTAAVDDVPPKAEDATPALPPAAAAAVAKRLFARGRVDPVSLQD